MPHKSTADPRNGNYDVVPVLRPKPESKALLGPHRSNDVVPVFLFRCNGDVAVTTPVSPWLLSTVFDGLLDLGVTDAAQFHTIAGMRCHFDLRLQQSGEKPVVRGTLSIRCVVQRKAGGDCCQLMRL